MNLNNLRDKAFATATAKGFHDKELSNEHFLMLVITELSEAVEADRRGEYLSEINRNRYNNLVDVDLKLAYETHIKGTVEEELADAAIRLLDLAGLIGIDVEISDDDIIKASKGFADDIFTESIMTIIGVIVDSMMRFDIKDGIICMLGTNFALAKHLDIDLLWHIEQKMKYNELREPLHGKAY